MRVKDENVAYAHLEVPSAEKATQEAHGEVVYEGLCDREDDNDAMLPQHDRRSPWKSTQVRAFRAGDADEDEPEASHAPKPKKAKTKWAAEPEQTTLTQLQGVKRTLSLQDPGIAAASAARNKMVGAALKKKKPSTQWRCWRCSYVLRDLSSRIAGSRIPRLGNSPLVLFFR